MEEEKEPKGGQTQTPKNALGNAFKKLGKSSKGKIFRKKIKRIVAVLLIFIVIGLIIAVLLAAIKIYLDKYLSVSSKNASNLAISYATNTNVDNSSNTDSSDTDGDSASNTDSSDTDEESSISSNRIIVDLGNITEDGAYTLIYEFRDEEGNLYTEEEAIQNIKIDLLEENEKLDLTKFSDSELKIIGTLMYNGLLVEEYNEEELKALAIFVKVDIASKNFDARSQSEMGKPISLEEIAENDYVYGILQMHRTKASEGYDSETPLEYIPYGDENTPGTFCYMDKHSDMNIMNKFSIDDNEKAVFAKWTKTSVSYTYKGANGQKLSDEEIAQNIPEDNIFKDMKKTTISTTPFNYKQYIEGYVVNYGLLSDLLVITQNTDFCLELAQLALNGKLVINIKEELSVTDSTGIETYNQTKLIYDYIDYRVLRKKIHSTSEWKHEASGSGNPNNSGLLQTYGWSSSFNPGGISGSASAGVATYQWTYEDINYMLQYRSNISGSSWSLFKEDVTITYEDLPPIQRSNELINLDHITENCEEYTIDEDYTRKEEFTYIIEIRTHIESNKNSYEISEIDSWYIKYHKQYEDPVLIPSDYSDERSTKGKYPEEATEVLTTYDASAINNVQEVKSFASQKEKDNSSENIVAECIVDKLTIKEKVKTDETKSFSSHTIRYRFGEEKADTTEVQVKNIKYVDNQPIFTNEDEEEIGFLYIYDKYINKGIDLYLQNDSENSLFDILEEDSSTHSYSKVIKFLLYVYDGCDRDVTSLEINIIDIESMNRVKGSARENYIKAWENGALWAYENGKSTIFPEGYLSEDESYYIVYEDGSEGHNNIAYRITTFISRTELAYNEDWGYGYYNWAEEFEAEGILVEDLYEGVYVDKDIVDSVFHNSILKHFADKVKTYLKTNLPEYKFSRAQKDALISVCYQYGNINGFADVYINSLNEDGEVDAEKIREWNRFNYTQTLNDRKYADWLLFTEGIYLDRSGNIIAQGSGTLVEAAYEVADHFLNSGVDVHYAGNEVLGAVHNGRGCVYGNIQGSWDEPIEKPDTCGVVCATFVTLAIWRADLIDEETINYFNYNSTGGVLCMIAFTEYADEWEKIESFDDLKEGDIVFTKNHVFIYMDGEMCLDQNYCVITSSDEDWRGQLTSAGHYRSDFLFGYRYIR